MKAKFRMFAMRFNKGKSGGGGPGRASIQQERTGLLIEDEDGLDDDGTTLPMQEGSNAAGSTAGLSLRPTAVGSGMELTGITASVGGADDDAEDDDDDDADDGSSLVLRRGGGGGGGGVATGNSKKDD